jgi:hypothetical protein
MVGDPAASITAPRPFQKLPIYDLAELPQTWPLAWRSTHLYAKNQYSPNPANPQKSKTLGYFTAD